MRYLFLIVIIPWLTLSSCGSDSQTKNREIVEAGRELSVSYAKGFSITAYKTYREIKVTAPWPESKDTLRYILYPEGATKPEVSKKAQYITTPVHSIVVTSTTDIPLLEALRIDSLLVGFPQTQYILSEKTKKRVLSGEIQELGNEQNLNIEGLLALHPQLLIAFSTSGQNANLTLIQENGIPVVLNGSWLEQHPLGRTEWIKFIAAFFNKEKEAAQIFNTIKQDYEAATAAVLHSKRSPTIMSGSLYKDVWYVPGGNSYMAQFYKDAKLTYPWQQDTKTGSLSLSIESVLEKAADAEFWITTKTLSSLNDLYQENEQYRLFTSFQNKNVYSTFNHEGGAGTNFYELGSLRPDLILKDFIKIGHPDVLPEYRLFFFKQLN